MLGQVMVCQMTEEKRLEYIIRRRLHAIIFFGIEA